MKYLLSQFRWAFDKSKKVMNEIFIIFPMRATYPAYSVSSDLVVPIK